MFEFEELMRPARGQIIKQNVTRAARFWLRVTDIVNGVDKNLFAL